MINDMEREEFRERLGNTMGFARIYMDCVGKSGMDGIEEIKRSDVRIVSAYVGNLDTGMRLMIRYLFGGDEPEYIKVTFGKPDKPTSICLNKITDKNTGEALTIDEQFNFAVNLSSLFLSDVEEKEGKVEYNWFGE